MRVVSYCVPLSTLACRAVPWRGFMCMWHARANVLLTYCICTFVCGVCDFVFSFRFVFLLYPAGKGARQLDGHLVPGGSGVRVLDRRAAFRGGGAHGHLPSYLAGRSSLAEARGACDNCIYILPTVTSAVRIAVVIRSAMSSIR